MAINLPYFISQGDTTNDDKIQANFQTLADATVSGAGDVAGPGSAVADDIAVFGDTTGKLIKDGGKKISDLSLTSHNHTGVYAPVLGADDNYVTDAEKIVIGNTSGTNSGDSASIPIGYLDTTVTLGTSDTKVPTQKAVKTYADNVLGDANALVYKGVIDCSANPNYPAANAGELYIVSVAGKIGGASGIVVEVGDMCVCNTDSTASGDQATVGTKWNVIEKNIVGAVTGPASSTDNHVAFFDSTTGKVIKDSGLTLSGSNTGDQTLPVKATGAELDTGTDDTKFATAKALKDSHNVPSVVPNTSGNLMTSNGTDWVSSAPPVSVSVTTKGDLQTFSTVPDRLPVGTDGYVLESRASEATGLKWVAPSAGGSVATDAIWDAKGDLAVGTGANTASKLIVGTNGQVLEARSTEATGLKWIDAPVVPVKASGAEVTTGTDDAKFATPKALADAGVNTRLKTKVISITRDMTAASGDVAYTGVGFTPTALIAIGASSLANQAWSVGVSDSARTQGDLRTVTSASIVTTGGDFLKITNAGSTEQAASVKSYDADGFTLTWTKTGSPTGNATILVLCFR